MRLRADTNNPKNVPKIGSLFVVSNVQKHAIWYKVELSSVRSDAFSTLEWENYITKLNEPEKLKKPVGNLCYSEHRRNLAEKIVEHIKTLLEGE